ncbi:retrovirus-related pol polyprotein from transposon TNT 1-94 [Tanacetum coccineum]
MPCVTSNVATPKVSVFEKYAIDVDPLPQPQRNNRGVYYSYLNRLRDTLDTLCEIVKEARSNRPSDNSLEYACVYTKHSKELLEYVNASCPNVDNKRDKFIATTPLTRKKHVTFADPLETSGNNTSKHVKQQSVQQTNSLIIPSTGVSTATTTRRSQPKHNTMNDKTLPANSVAKKKVEDRPRNNKSKMSKKNRVDSSIRVRRTVFNTNSNSLCKTCNECIVSFNHDKCVEHFLQSSKTPPVKKIWRVKQVKQTWTPTGKVFTTVGYHWKPTGRIFLLGYSKHMTGDRPRLRNFIKKFIGTVRLENDHFGAIMGYGDYVIGDSVIFRVYYMEGLGHNLFSVGQFCDSDLEVSFRKHSCFHRRLNHLNFDTINDLARKDLVRGLPRLKFEKDHLCSACQLGKSGKATHQPKTINIIMEVLHTLYMDLCGPLRVQSINGKKFILIIVDDYSSVGITHEKTIPRTPQQSGVVERRNRTLVEAAGTMLIFSKASMFL